LSYESLREDDSLPNEQINASTVDQFGSAWLVCLKRHMALISSSYCSWNNARLHWLEILRNLWRELWRTASPPSAIPDKLSGVASSFRAAAYLCFRPGMLPQRDCGNRLKTIGPWGLLWGVPAFWSL